MSTINEIQLAHERIRPFIHRTPVLTNKSLDRDIGARLYFKCENFQKTGSFKIRGATNAVMLLNDDDIAKGIVTASSGNHGAALAMAVKVRGGSVKVVMPKNTPQIKVENVKRNGGEIIWCEPKQKSRDQVLNKLLNKTGSVLIHPYNDANIIAGQGTTAKELLEDIPDLDIIISPVSGGGLLGGTLIFSKKINSKICVYGAEPNEANDAYRSLQHGEIQTNKTTNTICDGLRAQIGNLTFPIIKEKVDDIITVSENDIIRAMRMVWERMKIIVEPSCSITLAAIIKRKKFMQGKKIGLIMSGGNVDLSQLPFH